jgi:hypothetical protein
VGLYVVHGKPGRKCDRSVIVGTASHPGHVLNIGQQPPNLVILGA